MERIFGSNELLSSSATITTGGNGADAVLNIPEPEAPAPPSRPARDPYRGVVLVLLAAALLGMVAAIVGGWMTFEYRAVRTRDYLGSRSRHSAWR